MKKLLIIFILTANCIFAKDLLIVGAGYQLKPSHYKTEENRNLFFPVVVYKNYYLLGSEIGATVYKKDKWSFGTSLHYNTVAGFDNDNLDGVYGLLDSRKAQLEFGVDATHKDEMFRTDIFIKSDISGRSNGSYSGVKISKEFRPARPLFIIPSAQIIYYNDNYADYYYGVSDAESIRTGLNREKIDGFMATYLTAEFRIFLSEQFGFSLKNQFEILDLDSQIVEDKTNYIFELNLIGLF